MEVSLSFIVFICVLSATIIGLLLYWCEQDKRPISFYAGGATEVEGEVMWPVELCYNRGLYLPSIIGYCYSQAEAKQEVENLNNEFYASNNVIKKDYPKRLAALLGEPI